MIPRPVVSPTVIGTVICAPGDALTLGKATVTGGVPVAVADAVAVIVNVGVTLGAVVGVLVGVAVLVAVFVAVKVGEPLGVEPPLTVTLPFVVNAGGSPSFHANPGWNPIPGSV